MVNVGKYTIHGLFGFVLSFLLKPLPGEWQLKYFVNFHWPNFGGNDEPNLTIIFFQTGW